MCDENGDDMTLREVDENVTKFEMSVILVFFVFKSQSILAP